MILHRTALTITRNQPYADWAKRPSDDQSAPVLYRDDLPRTVYLVPVIDPFITLEKLLDEFWRDIFEEELAAWSEDEATWPALRTREMFDRWFAVEFTDAVVDLAPEQPLTESDMEEAALAGALGHCAWCAVELGPNEGRNVGLTVAERERLASREGLALTLFVSDGQPLAGVLTGRNSPAAAQGNDLVFRACTSRCEKLIRKEAPRALRHLLRHLPNP